MNATEKSELIRAVANSLDLWDVCARDLDHGLVEYSDEPSDPRWHRNYCLINSDPDHDCAYCVAEFMVNRVEEIREKLKPRGESNA